MNRYEILVEKNDASVNEIRNIMGGLGLTQKEIARFYAQEKAYIARESLSLEGYISARRIGLFFKAPRVVRRHVWTAQSTERQLRFSSLP